MKVLITGADGFVGAHVTRALVAAGMDVVVLVRSGQPFRRLHAVANQVQCLQGDFTEITRFKPALAHFGPDACVHLAWYAEPGKYLHAPQNVSMLNSSLTLIQTLAEIDCKHIITAGTCAEYDAKQGWLKEEGPTCPETLYAAAKLSLCLMGEQAARALGMTFAHARLFYPFGPGEDPRRMVPALIRSLLAEQPFPASTGEQIRDYIYVEDIAQAFLTLLAQKASGIYNIGSGEPISVHHLMHTIENVVGQHGLIQFGALTPRDWEPRFLCADAQKLRSLGWKPRFTLESGLNQTVDWWRAQRA